MTVMNVQVVHSSVIVCRITAVLSHREPASAGTARHNCSAQGTLCIKLRGNDDSIRDYYGLKNRN